MRPFIAAIFAAALILPIPAGAFYAKSVFAEGVQLVAAEKKTKKKKDKKDEKVKAAPAEPSKY